MIKSHKLRYQTMSTDVTFLPASTATSRHAGSLPFAREKHPRNVPIIDYLSIIKSQPETDHAPSSKVQAVTVPKKNQIKTSQKHNQGEVLLLQEITSKRRHQKISFQNKGMTLFRKYEMAKTVEALLGIYEYYIQFGYSPNKITSIVKLHCADKKELQWIFLKKIRSHDGSKEFCSQYRNSSNEILNRLLRTIIGRKEQLREQVVLDVCYFKAKIEQDLVEKGKSKMKELTVSISKEKRNLTTKIQEMSATCANINGARIHHRSLPEDQLNKLNGPAHRIQDHGNIFKVNRMLFREWTQAQNFQ